MALIRGSSLVGAVSGVVDNLVFSASRFGAIVRRRPNWVDRGTIAQDAARSAPGRIAAGWQGLTSDQRKAWRLFAQGIVETNRLGMDRSLTGWLLYWRQAAIRYGGAPPAGLVAPASTGMIAPEYIGVHFLEGGPFSVTSWGYPYPTSSVIEFLYVSRFGYLQQVSGFKRRLRIMDHTKSLPNVDLWSDAAGKEMELLDDERVGVALRWQIDAGLPSKLYWGSGDVGSNPWTIDDFEEEDLGPYTGDTGAFSFDNVVKFEGDYSLEGEIGAVPLVDKRLLSVHGLEAYPLRGQEFQVRMYLSAQVRVASAMFGVVDDANYYVVLLNQAVGQVILRRLIAGVPVQLAISGVAAFPVGEWLRVAVEWKANSDMEVSVYNAAGGLTHTCTGNDNTYVAGGIGYGVQNVNNQACSLRVDLNEIVGKAT